MSSSRDKWLMHEENHGFVVVSNPNVIAVSAKTIKKKYTAAILLF